MGTYALSKGYYDVFFKKASQVRTLMINDFKKTFRKSNVIITPVAPTPAFKIGEKIDFAPGYSLARIKAPASFDEKTVMELQLRQKYNVNLVAIKRGEHSKIKKQERGQIINVPMPNTMIYQEDVLMIAGSDTDMAKLPQE